MIGSDEIIGRNSRKMRPGGCIPNPDRMCTARRHHRDHADFKIVSVAKTSDIMFPVLRSVRFVQINYFLVIVVNGTVRHSPACNGASFKTDVGAINLRP